MKIYYKDGGVLLCYEIVWTGECFIADDFYVILPDDIEKIVEE